MRFVRSLLVAAALVVSAPALAFEIKPYDAAVVQKAIASGKPVVVHVFAPWCLQCRAQENILNRLSGQGTYDNIQFFRVNYDQQKDVVKAFDVPRSTLIAFKGGKETGRMSWGVTEASVVKVLAEAE